MASPAWRVPTHLSFHWRSWDNEYVVYHVNSGDTHRLNAAGARALRLLVESPRTTHELAECLGDEFPGDAGEPILATVEELVRRFEQLGLVEPDA